MTVQTETVLKGYFDQGDRPTEAQFDALIESAKRPRVRVASSTPDTVSAADDQVIAVDTATIAAAVAVNLPAGANVQRVLIKDMGSAGTYNITINPNGAETIEGAASLVLNTNYQWVELFWPGTGTAWLVMNEGS